MRRRRLNRVVFTKFAIVTLIVAIGSSIWVNSARGAWGTLSDMHNYHECFGLEPEKTNYPSSGTSPTWQLQGRFKVVMIESNAPGNVYHEGDKPQFRFQIENLTDRPISCSGKIEVIRYSQEYYPGDMWYPFLRRHEVTGSVPLSVDLDADEWANITAEPPMAEIRGGYGYVVDLGDYGRQFLTSAVRTFAPPAQRIQYPKQCLEHMPAPILERLGIQAVRYGIGFYTKEESGYQQVRKRVGHDLTEMYQHKVTCIAEIGAGTGHQPLGRGRPHLDENGVMRRTKKDLCWLPEYDDEYQEFVYELACEYGWPKGPITGFMLWNEPWEGSSISGWGADIPRYRELYKRMGDAVFQAREDAGVDVLVGGCDSSTNTIDKLFADGSDEFLPYLDFCSIHYQGLNSPVLYPEWNNRTHHKGRVRIWDTESWTANTDERFLSVVASNRAAGYDRSLGSLSRIAVSTLSHHRIGKEIIQTREGEREIERVIESRPLAAAYGAVQHFLGERDFREILFHNGLPWVFVFDGIDNQPDDGRIVLVGDIEPLFATKKNTGVLFNSVRSLHELQVKEDLKKKLAGLPADAKKKREEISRRLEEKMSFENVFITFKLPKGCAVYDHFGNPVASAANSRVTLPLDERGFFLKADNEHAGSFRALLNALRYARVRGLEPLDSIACDMTRPIEEKPVMKLRLTNQHNHAIRGTLDVRLGELKLEYPKKLTFQPREQKWIEVQITGGKADASNDYPLELKFDAGQDGIARHAESMRVNCIARRSICVDGKLDDWKGVLPQPISVADSGQRDFTEAMLFPFTRFDTSQSEGLAVGYVAYDDDCFYFAAKIADDTPQEGCQRFATRGPDKDFYPKICYEPVNSKGRAVEFGKHDTLRPLHWPEGVRRFSYRRWPDIPSSMPQIARDNVLIAFNAIPLGQDGWESHQPGRMPKFVRYKSTDYEFALNKVAEKYGGGTEIWRQWIPGMVYKHFYPRQPKYPQEGPARGKLEVRYVEGSRIVECALPWSEIPHVDERRKAGKPVKFSFRVNHQNRGPDMELARGRSVAEGNSPSFHPGWAPHWPNELEFGFEE